MNQEIRNFKHEDKPGNWIPTNERLPEKQDEYMVTWISDWHLKKGDASLATIEYTKEEGWILESYMKCYSNVKITAWMPLPKPYREVSE